LDDDEEEEDLPPDLDRRSAPAGVLGPDPPADADATATAASRRQTPAPAVARRTPPPPNTGACAQRRRPSAFLTFLHAPSIAATRKPNKPPRPSSSSSSRPTGFQTPLGGARGLLNPPAYGLRRLLDGGGSGGRGEAVGFGGEQSRHGREWRWRWSVWGAASSCVWFDSPLSCSREAVACWEE